MRVFNCPSCGAPVTFHASVSVYAVCAHCQSMILCRDVGIEAFGKMATLPPDMSPLRIGAQGVLDGVGFALLGRLRIGWRDGAWNEWFMVTEHARKGWLAEAQGFFAACFEVPLEHDGQNLIDRDFATWKPKAGERVQVGDQTYEVADIKQTTCLGSEGELPFLANRGRQAVSIDLEGTARFASLEVYQKTGRLYQGRYVGWDELKLSNIRPLEGW